MDLWLFALIAIALVPVVRLFMAAGCRRPEDEPGDHSLFVTVSADPSLPEGSSPHLSDPEVRIIAGEVEVHPPSGRPDLSVAIPEGGLFSHSFGDIPQEAWEGVDPPYRWSANCSVTIVATGGPPEVPRGTLGIPGTTAADWNAHRDGLLNFRVHLENIGREERPGLNFRWVMTASGP
jgi:hypothetical protein